jgi:hypothetical protein
MELNVLPEVEQFLEELASRSVETDYVRITLTLLSQAAYRDGYRDAIKEVQRLLGATPAGQKLNVKSQRRAAKRKG